LQLLREFERDRFQRLEFFVCGNSSALKNELPANRCNLLEIVTYLRNFSRSLDRRSPVPILVPRKT